MMTFVPDMLEGDPRLYLEKGRYSVGDTLRGNCSAPPSNPPANITWTISGKKASLLVIFYCQARCYFVSVNRKLA